MTTTVHGIDGLKELVGAELGTSSPVRVTQEAVNRFADATGDHQWIHVDVERAKAGPFGGPIAHGYLTLSLLPALLPTIFVVEGVSMGVNYGLNKLRFPSPVPVGSEVVCTATLAAVDDIAGGAQVTLGTVTTVIGAPKPSCVAEVIFRYYS
ncbi:MAG: MaoC family dehydratase [Acidimicrobiales bacterium]